MCINIMPDDCSFSFSSFILRVFVCMNRTIIFVRWITLKIFAISCLIVMVTSDACIRAFFFSSLLCFCELWLNLILLPATADARDCVLLSLSLFLWLFFFLSLSFRFFSFVVNDAVDLPFLPLCGYIIELVHQMSITQWICEMFDTKLVAKQITVSVEVGDRKRMKLNELVNDEKDKESAPLRWESPREREK